MELASPLSPLPVGGGPQGPAPRGTLVPPEPEFWEAPGRRPPLFRPLCVRLDSHGGGGGLLGAA